MSQPFLNQELTFSGNASDQHCKAYVPDVLNGQYVEFIIYVQFSTASAAGKVQLQTAHASDYSGTWANVGSTIDWAANTSEKYLAVTGVFGALRLDIDTAITSGSVKAFIVAAAHS